jgi:hypothetical protein
MRAPSPPVEALLWQVAAVALVLGGLQTTELALDAGWIAALIGVLALLFTVLRPLPRWWWPIQLLFAPMIWLLLLVEIPPLAWFLAFALFALIYWTTFRTQVPLFLSGRRVWDAVVALLPPATSGQALRFIDLGSGLGGLLGHLGRQRPDGSYTGIEIAPLPAWLSRLRFAVAGPANVRVLRESFWEHDLGDYDVVFAFLSPVPMPELWNKARREMRAGSLLISCAFEVPGHPADDIIEAGPAARERLHVWRMGAAAGRGTAAPHISGRA